jgi:hypothetical protein
MDFEERLFKIVPKYLDIQRDFAEEDYNLTWDSLHSYTHTDNDIQQELEELCWEGWHYVRICTNDAQDPERWFEQQISLVRDGWYRDSPTMLTSVTDFVTTVCKIMEPGRSVSNLAERVVARKFRNQYIAENLGTYPPPNTRGELFETVATILRKVWTTTDESEESSVQPALQAWKALAWEVSKY